MSRPLLEMADLVRAAGTAFLERNRQWIRWAHIKVLLAIARCRTAALGGHIDECSRCGHRAAISYNSCRNRHCPKCQTGARERWLEARHRFLLHLLPKGFVRIRHFGFLANRRRATLLPLCRQALAVVQPQTQPEASTAKETRPLWLCPNCGGPMVVIERLTAAQIQLRSPPSLSGVAA